MQNLTPYNPDALHDLIPEMIRPGNYFLGRQSHQDPFKPIRVRENLGFTIFVKICNTLSEPFQISLAGNARLKRPLSDYLMPIPLTYDSLRDLMIKPITLRNDDPDDNRTWLQLPQPTPFLIAYDVSKITPPTLYLAPDGPTNARPLLALSGVHHLQNLVLDLTGIKLTSLTMT